MTPSGEPLQSYATADLVRRDSPRSLRGFATMWRNEQRHWWGTRRWAIQLALWIVLLDGSVLAQLLDARSGGPVARAATLHDAADMFFVLGMLATAVGVVITMQASVAGEVSDGTASWVLSKPLSRGAYLMAKLATGSLNFLTLAVVIPSAVYVGEFRLMAGYWPTSTSTLASIMLWAAHVTFYVCLTLLLGVLSKRPAAVTGTALTVLVAGQIIFGSGQPLPWGLPSLAGDIASGNNTATAAVVPFLVTMACSGLIYLVTLRRFNRSEI